MRKLTLRLIAPLITAVAVSVASAAASPLQSTPLQAVPDQLTLTAERADERTLEGVWDSQVTLTDCNGHTLAAFEAYVMFHQGGTLTSTDNTPPTLHGPGFGTWQRMGGRNYNAHFQFFNFNADGTFAGVQKIDTQIHPAAHGNSYTSTVAFAAYDVNGNLIFSGCGTEVATRIE